MLRGSCHTEEAKIRIGIASKSRIRTKEWCQKISQALKGKTKDTNPNLIRTKEQEERQRIKSFSKYGYQTLIIWESELMHLKRLKRKIIKFHNT